MCNVTGLGLPAVAQAYENTRGSWDYYADEKMWREKLLREALPKNSAQRVDSTDRHGQRRSC